MTARSVTCLRWVHACSVYHLTLVRSRRCGCRARTGLESSGITLDGTSHTSIYLCTFRIVLSFNRTDLAYHSDASFADPWERLLSDHCDSIRVSTIKGSSRFLCHKLRILNARLESVIVRRYDESALIPWEKHEDQFYCCYNYNFEQFKVTVSEPS